MMGKLNKNASEHLSFLKPSDVNSQLPQDLQSEYRVGGNTLLANEFLAGHGSKRINAVLDLMYTNSLSKIEGSKIEDWGKGIVQWNAFKGEPSQGFITIAEPAMQDGQKAYKMTIIPGTPYHHNLIKEAMSETGTETAQLTGAQSAAGEDPTVTYKKLKIGSNPFQDAINKVKKEAGSHATFIRAAGKPISFSAEEWKNMYSAWQPQSKENRLKGKESGEKPNLKDMGWGMSK